MGSLPGGASAEEIYEALRTWDEPPLIHHSMLGFECVILIKHIETFDDTKDAELPKDYPIKAFWGYALAGHPGWNTPVAKIAMYNREDGIDPSYLPVNHIVTKKILTHPTFVTSINRRGHAFLAGKLRSRRVTTPYEQLKKEVYLHGRMGNIPIPA